MNISPTTGRPKIVKADEKMVERFMQFCRMLSVYSDRMDVASVGPDAQEAKQAAEKLLRSVRLEMLPRDKRPKVAEPDANVADSDANVADSEAKASDDDAKVAEPDAKGKKKNSAKADEAKSPGEGEV